MNTIRKEQLFKKLKGFFLFICILGILSFNALFLSFVSAEDAQTPTTPSTKSIITQTLNSAGTSAGYSETTNKDTLITTIGQIIQIILSFLGIAFIILVIISGIQWMTAEGNDDAVKKAKTRMKNATIGLVITLLAYAITYFVLGILTDSGIKALG